MPNSNLKVGDVAIHKHIVSAADIAAFESGIVHSVYSTFALARDFEWVGRLLLLQWKSEGEEGIGTMLEIVHKSPAFLDEEVELKAVATIIEKNYLEVSVQATVGTRLIATGRTGQKLLSIERLKDVFRQKEV